MKKLILISIYIGGIYSMAARALVERDVTLEIESIDGAQSYEVEIKKVDSGEIRQSKIDNHEWTGRLPIGKYEMRNRSIDQRGVPGNWSIIDSFEVGIDKPIVLEPLAKASLNAEAGTQTKVHFQWQAVDGATEYSVEIKNLDSSFTVQQSTIGTALDQDVPSAQKLKWKVIAQGPEGLASETEGELEVFGGPLEAPTIETPINIRTPQIVWNGSPEAESFEIKIERYQAKTKRWENLFTSKTTSREGISLNDQFPDGAYRATVAAQSELRQPSPAAVVNFRVRRLIAPPQAGAWYLRVSGSADANHYSSSINDVTPTSVDSHAIGETVRLEVGRLKIGDRWGASISGDFSTFQSGSDSMSATGAEISLLRRDGIGSRGELLSSLSIRYKDLPVMTTNATAMGPGLGLRYSHRLSTPLGLHIGVHVDDSLLSIKVPNGQAIDSSLSYSADLLFSYRFDRRFVGYAGYQRKDDQVRYPALNGAGTNGSSIRSDSLNLIFEYDF